MQALCLPNPIYDLVIGNITDVHLDTLGNCGMNTANEIYQEKVIPYIEASECVVTPFNSAGRGDFNVKTNACTESEGSTKVGPSTNDISGKEAGRELPIGEVKVIGGAVQTRGGRVREIHPLKPLLIRGIPEYQQCSPKQFKEARGSFFEWAKEPFQGNNSSVKWFEMDGDLLVRRYKRPEDGILLRQVMVPKKLRSEVLRLAHEDILAGHLGIKKSSDRILTNFYWPGILGDIRRLCQSCNICQRTVNNRNVKKAPVQSVPWVHLPFDKVAIDLIDPLYPVTNRGKRYILTVVDYATPYPEAVPLEKKIDTKTIAEALMGIFSRVGYSRELLRDNETQFVSQVMREVSRLTSVKQLFSSPYHPMANGLCETFNGTLKKMLIRMSSEQPK